MSSTLLRYIFKRSYFPFQFKKQGTVCREVKFDYDVKEFCSGDSGDVRTLLLPLNYTLEHGTRSVNVICIHDERTPTVQKKSYLCFWWQWWYNDVGDNDDDDDDDQKGDDDDGDDDSEHDDDDDDDDDDR